MIRRNCWTCAHSNALVNQCRNVRLELGEATAVWLKRQHGEGLRQVAQTADGCPGYDPRTGCSTCANRITGSVMTALGCAKMIGAPRPFPPASQWESLWPRGFVGHVGAAFRTIANWRMKWAPGAMSPEAALCVQPPIDATGCPEHVSIAAGIEGIVAQALSAEFGPRR